MFNPCLGYEEGLGWEEYAERSEAEDAYKAQLAEEENKSGLQGPPSSSSPQQSHSV